MEPISESRWHEIKQINQRVSVVGRSLLLGTGAGFTSGAGMGLAIGVADPQYLEGMVVFGGIVGLCIGVIFGAILAPLVLWRARVAQGRPSARERIGFGCMSIIPIILVWRVFSLGASELGLLLFLVAFGIGVACTALCLGWCMRPFSQGGPPNTAEA